MDETASREISRGAFLGIIIISISIMNKGERYVGNKKGKPFEEKKR